MNRQLLLFRNTSSVSIEESKPKKWRINHYYHVLQKVDLGLKRLRLSCVFVPFAFPDGFCVSTWAIYIDRSKVSSREESSSLPTAKLPSRSQKYPRDPIYFFPGESFISKLGLCSSSLLYSLRKSQLFCSRSLSLFRCDDAVTKRKWSLILQKKSFLFAFSRGMRFAPLSKHLQERFACILRTVVLVQDLKWRECR